MHPGAMARTRRLDNYSGWLEVPQNLEANAGTLWEDFETYADWTLSGGTGGPPSITDDTTNYVTGTHSILFNANGATGNIDIYKTVSFDLDATGTYWQFWIMNNLGTGFQISLFLSATWPTKYFNYIFDVPGDTPGKWQLIRFNKHAHAAPAGGMTHSDTITRVTFRTSGSTITYNIDGMYHSVETQPAVLFTFDDVVDKTTLNGPHALDRHNMIATAGMIGNEIGLTIYATVDHLNEIIRHGWVVVNHSESHPNYTTLTQAQIETELANCVSDLDAAGVVGHMADLYAIYPNGGYDADTEAAMAAQSFRLGRSIRTVSLYYPKMSMEEIDQRDYDIHSDQWLTLANFKTHIDATKAMGKISVFYNHGVDRDVLSGSDITISMLGQVAAWCARYKFIVLTFDDLWQLRSGPVRVRRPKRANTAW